MYTSLKVVVLIASILTAAVAWPSESRAERLPIVGDARAMAGCLQATSRDSSQFWEMAHSLASDSSMTVERNFADVQMSDSIAYFGTSAQCDTVAQRYRAYYQAKTGNANLPVLEFFMIRIGPNRIIANPLASREDGAIEFVTLDSSLNIIKVWAVL